VSIRFADVWQKNGGLGKLGGTDWKSGGLKWNRLSSVFVKDIKKAAPLTARLFS
jgi:hypothetical protein